MFGKKKKVDLEKGHDMTIAEVLRITEQLDKKLSDMGMCSHQISMVGTFLAQANSLGDMPNGMHLGGMVSSEDMKEILKTIADKMDKE